MDLPEIIKENFSAIIGILGTLIGVILGFILNVISKSGRLKIFQNQVQYSISKRNNSGGFEPMNEISDETIYLKISLNLHLYNSSGNRKVMRNFKFLVKPEKGILAELFLGTLTKNSDNGEIYMDSFKFLNINPKEIIHENCKIIVSKNFQKILKSEWYLTYENSRGKNKLIKINKKLLKKA